MTNLDDNSTSAFRCSTVLLSIGTRDAASRVGGRRLSRIRRNLAVRRRWRRLGLIWYSRVVRRLFCSILGFPCKLFFPECVVPLLLLDLVDGAAVVVQRVEDADNAHSQDQQEIHGVCVAADKFLRVAHETDGNTCGGSSLLGRPQRNNEEGAQQMTGRTGRGTAPPGQSEQLGAVRLSVVHAPGMVSFQQSLVIGQSFFSGSGSGAKRSSSSSTRRCSDADTTPAKTTEPKLRSIDDRRIASSSESARLPRA